MDGLIYNLLDLFVFSLVEGMLYFFIFCNFLDKKIKFKDLIINSIIIDIFIFLSSKIFNTIPLNQILIVFSLIIYLNLFEKICINRAIIFSIFSVSYLIITEFLFVLIFYGDVYGFNVSLKQRLVIFLFSRILDFILVWWVFRMKTFIGSATRR